MLLDERFSRVPSALSNQYISENFDLTPICSEAWGNLAITYALSDNRAAALEAVRELRRYDPQKADKLFNLIMLK